MNEEEVIPGSNSRKGAPLPSPSHGDSPPVSKPRRSSYRILEMDLRGLDPPEPMVRILKMAGGISFRDELQALTDRRPVHLYAQLAERGCSAVTEALENGSFITRIRKRN